MQKYVHRYSFRRYNNNVIIRRLERAVRRVVYVLYNVQAYLPVLCYNKEKRADKFSANKLVEPARARNKGSRLLSGSCETLRGRGRDSSNKRSRTIYTS